MTMTKDKTEIRDQTNKIELREDDSGERVLSGYAVKWNTESRTIGLFRKFKEQFRHGSFAESLRDNNQFALWSHDVNQPIGSVESGTLRLSEDHIGLRFEIDLGDDPRSQQVHSDVKRGIVKGVSFGFRNAVDDWDDSNPDEAKRTISKAELIEVSPTPFPAYPDSEVSARGYDPLKEHEQETEERNEEQAAKIRLLTLI